MGDELLVVELVMDVKAVPQVTADDDASKTQFLCHTDIVEVDTSEGIHLLVDKTAVGSSLKSGVMLLDGMLVVALGECVLKEDILSLLACFANFIRRSASARKFSLISIGQGRSGIIYVNAAQSILFFQIKMLVHCRLAVEFVRQQGE